MQKKKNNIGIILEKSNLQSKALIVFFSLFSLSATLKAQKWIPIAQEAKPYTRWWWLGSAVDSTGLEYNLTELAKVGIGGVEITPIYGVKGNDANEISYLSPRICGG